VQAASQRQLQSFHDAKENSMHQHEVPATDWTCSTSNLTVTLANP